MADINLVTGPIFLVVASTVGLVLAITSEEWATAVGAAGALLIAVALWSRAGTREPRQ